MTLFGRYRTRLFAGAAVLTLLAAAGAAQALPTGGVVVADTGGGATISTDYPVTTVNQNADRVVINWDTFDVASNETVNFNQNSEISIAFNRVLSTNVTTIDGHINGYGGVFLFTPGGMVIGSNAQINVGSFLASSVQLPTGEFSNVLNDNFINMPAPTTLNGANPFPGVTVSQGAVINAYSGFAALVGPTIRNDGSIGADVDSVLFMGAEGGYISYVVQPPIECECAIGGGLFLEDASADYVVGRGRVSVTQGSTGFAYAGGGFMLVTPPPVLEPGFASAINLSGTIQADGAVFDSPDSVVLLAGGALPPGHEDASSGLVSSGSLPINLDAGNATIIAAQDITVQAAGSVTLGDVDSSGGDLLVEAFGDITLDGDVNVPNGVFLSNGLELAVDGGGVGGVAINGDLITDDEIAVSSSGNVTIAPGVRVSAESGLFIGNDHAGNSGVASLAIGQDADVVSFGEINIYNQGGLVMDTGAEMFGDFVQVTNRGTAGAVLHNNAILNGGSGLSIINPAGPLVVEEGAVVSSFYYDGPDPFERYPVGVYDRAYGGLYILASDIDLKGSMFSSFGEGGIAPIVIESAPGVTHMIIGGTDGPAAPGVFQLSQSEFGNIFGTMMIGAGPNSGPTPPLVELRDLSIDGASVPVLSVISFGDGDILVSGTVDSANVQVDPDIWFGRFIVSDVTDEGADDVWASLFPRDIIITGALGTNEGPLGDVRMLATRDILIGTPSYVNAARNDPAFDPQFPQQVAAPEDGHLFVRATHWQMSAPGRIIQQNSALVNAGHSGFLIDQPQNGDELITARDIGQDLADLENDYETEFDFGDNPPVFPDFTTAPTRISLHGAFDDDGFLVTDDNTASAPNVLYGGFGTGPTYYMNDCQIGGCATSTLGGFFPDFLPASGYQYPAIIARRPGVTIVNQASERVLIDWHLMDVDSENTLTFNTLSDTAITFNRSGFSIPIYGVVQGNAGVFIFSSEGIYVGPSGSIDVGSLLLSSLELTGEAAHDALSNNSIALDPSNSESLLPAVFIDEGANVSTSNGFAALIGPAIGMNGSLEAHDTVLFGLGQSAVFSYEEGADGLVRPNIAMGYFAGSGLIEFEHTGSTTAGQGFILVTPPPVLQTGEDFVIAIGGTITANGTYNDNGESVLLWAGGANRPGFNNGVLVHSGSGSISLDTTEAVIQANGIVSGASYSADFGPITSTGGFFYGTIGDIEFWGPMDVGHADFSNGMNLPFNVTGTGDVKFHANFHSDGSISFGTFGNVTFDPGIVITADQQIVWGHPSPTVGTRNVTFGDGVQMIAGTRISWNGNNGNTVIGNNVLIDSGGVLGLQAQNVTLGTNSTLHADDRMTVISFGDTTVGQNSHIIAERGVAATSVGRFTLGSGGSLESHYSPPDDVTYPLAVYGFHYGGVYLAASDVDIQGQIISTKPLGGSLGSFAPNALVEAPTEPGILIFDIGANANSAIVGGPDAANQAGVWRLSANEFSRLRGNVTVLSAPDGEASPVSIEVQSLTLTAGQNPFLTIATSGDADVRVTGLIESANSEGIDTGFRVGEFLIFDNQQGIDGWVNLIPRDILITGQIGTEENPVAVVGLIAQRNILMGTQSYIDAALANTAFDPLRPPATVTASPADKLFISARVFEFVAGGRVFQQNTGTPFAPNGLLFGAPTDETPLVVAFDFQAALDDLEGGFQFGSNPPEFPDFAAGPIGISLYGTLIGDGETITGPDVSQVPFLLSDGLIQPPRAYYFNGCEFYGACPTGEITQIVTYRDPTVAQGEDGFDVLDDLNIPRIFIPNVTDLIADFIVAPDYDPNPDPNGIGQAVTGSGNGDLWITPRQEAQ